MTKELTAREALEMVLKLADELCTAVDLEAEDIGGSRPSLEILGELGPAVDAANDALAASLPEQGGAGKVQEGWIKCNERMPEHGDYVLAFVQHAHAHDGPSRRVRAFYAEKFTVESGADDEFSDYSEEKDEFYLPEGWYECNEYEDTHWHVNELVTHWMPLPAAPDAALAASLPEQGGAGKVSSNRTEVIALANEVDQIGEALMSTNKIRGMQLVSLGARIALLSAAPSADKGGDDER